jgi:uncharacterized damage-inducible protein DinB
MDMRAFRQFYDYHFAENQKILTAYLPQLTEDQFNQDCHYSHGSVHHQIFHLLNVDDAWFSGLRDEPYPDQLSPQDFASPHALRSYAQQVEQKMRDYLESLTDEKLLEKPLPNNDEDKDLLLWQVLLHVVNHGTDHRAQILRQLNEFGVQTGPQDYIFYVYQNP